MREGRVFGPEEHPVANVASNAAFPRGWNEERTMSNITPESPNDDPAPVERPVTEPDESASPDAPIAESAVMDPQTPDAVEADSASVADRADSADPTQTVTASDSVHAAEAERVPDEEPAAEAEPAAAVSERSEPAAPEAYVASAGSAAGESSPPAPAVGAAEGSADWPEPEPHAAPPVAAEPLVAPPVAAEPVAAEPLVAAPLVAPTVVSPVAVAPTEPTAVAAPAKAPAGALEPTAAPPAAETYSVPQVTPVYLPAPVPPKRKGNRGAGILIALLATLAYAIVSAIVVLVIFLVTKRTIELAVQEFAQYVATASYIIPIVFFALAFFLLIAIVNRGGWWAYVLGAFFVAVVVYFSYVGGVLLTIQAWQFTPAEVARILNQLWANPLTIGTAVVAREVPIWFGAWIAARGRKVRERNDAAQREYEREVAAGPVTTPRSA